MTTAVLPTPLEHARALSGLIRAHAADAEREGRLAPPVLDALTDAGLFQLLMPAEAGGPALDLLDVQQVLEEVAAADGATGWCLMIGAGGNAFSAWLDPDGGRELLARNARVVTAGMFSPTGRADVVEGGYRASGRWAFGSGCLHSTVLLGNCVVHEDGVPQTLESGAPRTVMVFFPASSATIVPRWDVMGLRATGSHDYEIHDVFVPARHTARLFSDPARYPDPTYRLPFQMLLWLWMAPTPLGIARGALEAFAEHARSGQRSGYGPGHLRDHPATQVRYATAHAALASARTYVRDVSTRAWAVALAGETPSKTLVAETGLAARHAAQTAARVTETLYELAGTSALRSDSPIQRYFRDAHAAMHHIAFGLANDEHAGRVLLQGED